MFVIAGVTGKTGRAAAEALLAHGKPVRALVRDSGKADPWRTRGAEVAVASLEDEAALAAALRGASGLYVLLPEDPGAPDFHGQRRRMADAIASAVRKSGVGHVVLLSAAAAVLPSGNGPAADLHYAEGVPSADAAVPMVAACDVGRLAARCLAEPPAASEVIDFTGPAYSMRELGAKLGAALGKTLNVVEIPAAAQVEALTQAGLSRAFAETVAELMACFSSGKVKPGGSRALTGGTTIDEVLPSLLAQN